MVVVREVVSLEGDNLVVFYTTKLFPSRETTSLTKTIVKYY
jgi:hypothetical protein